MLTQPDSIVDSADMPTSMPDMLDSRNWFSPIPENRRRAFNQGQRQGVRIEVNGKEMVNFASNDYLGLSTHPDVCRAAIELIERHGAGSGASRLISGDDPLYHRLEQELAAWKGFEAALLVGSGMLANMGLLPALGNRHTTLFCDRLNHASLVDGARLSAAHVVRFKHLDIKQLKKSMQKYASERTLIVSDGVFSMDGDCANVGALLKLAEKYDGLLILDDAHGFGTAGKDGRGLSSVNGAAGHPRLIEIGTCGKALGSYGAFILGSSEIIEGLRQRLRTMTYSTALPTHVCAASLAALHVQQDGTVVRKLQQNVALFRQLAEQLSLPLSPSSTPIQPLLLGDDHAALQASGTLAQRGFFVSAIRPPTVPEGTARLRITLSAAHKEEDIAALTQALAEVMN